MTLRIAELRAGNTPQRDAVLAGRLANAGFDTILIDARGDASALEPIARACASRKLALWVALVPDADGLPLLSSRVGKTIEPWLVDSDDALDPRRPVSASHRATIHPDAALAGAWTAAIEVAREAGVSGFVVRDPERLPSPFWDGVIRASRTPTWVAWTPGLSPAAIDALRRSGFDGVCSSFAWWDARSAWLSEERTRHRGAMQLAFAIDPDAPFDADEASSLIDRLWLSAIVGDAWLVPDAVWRLGSLDATIARIAQWLSARTASSSSEPVHILSGPDAPVTAIARIDAPDARAASHAVVVLINPDPRREAAFDPAIVTAALSGFGRYRTLHDTTTDDPEGTLDPSTSLVLAPHALRIFEGARLAPIVLPIAKDAVADAIEWPRIAIEAVSPAVDDGAFPVKRIAGECVRVEADIVIDGHEKLAAVLAWRVAGDEAWREVRMEPLGNDRFAASFPLERVGRHEYTIEAWRDVFATYRNELQKKSAAGLDVSLELAEGSLLVADALAVAKHMKDPDLVARLAALGKALGKVSRTIDRLDATTMATRVAALLASQTLDDLRTADARAFAIRTPKVYGVDAERRGAGFASWYELFPRSQGNAIGDPLRHGTFDDVIARLPAVRDMGFDVLYFPPIHPIGTKNRKGRNNSLTPTADDPGSPYAIGSPDGGHDALHPELGTFDDFRRLREAALAHGLELALDFAIQCSPDHPWLKDHPGWFAWRPDGSLRYAENPPKKYEDIVNVDFYGNDDEPSALWLALRDVILLWVDQGVKLFRVDNPHTKPLPFWQWMIGEVRAQHPDVVFLSEAFTRPKVMYRLAKVGFSQSYTYFTWRHTKQEFIEYLTELTTTAPREFFRPHFFVNTPDINPVFLQRSGRPGFLIRAALAATLSGLWGIYSGFELCEASPVPGKEDYLDSEKYELRAWDWQRPGHIIEEITTLNRIRRQNPALHSHLNIRFHNAFDPDILYFMKATEDRSNIVLVAINLDPHGVHEADFELPLWEWSLPDDATVGVTDLLDERRTQWSGKIQRVRLDPFVNPYAIWRVTLAS